MVNKVDKFCTLLKTTINSNGERVIGTLDGNIDPTVSKIYSNNKYHNIGPNSNRDVEDSFHYKLSLLFERMLKDPFCDKNYDEMLKNIMSNDDINIFLARCSDLGNLLASNCSPSQIAFGKEFEVLLDEYTLILENYFATEENKEKKNTNNYTYDTILFFAIPFLLFIALFN